MTREKLQIPFPVIVEGRYDRLRLECVMEGQILTTDGFGVFRRQEKTQLFRALAERTPLILLTDSDGAGKLIRAHLTSVLPADRLIQLYIPRVAGTERRKQQPSAEGTLGVEGMEQALLYDLRDALAQRLKLPPGMTPNAFLAALRVLLTYEEYLAAVGRNGI